MAILYYTTTEEGLWGAGCVSIWYMITMTTVGLTRVTRAIMRLEGRGSAPPPVKIKKRQLG